MPEGEPLTPQTAKAGQTVFLKSLGKDGTIIAVNGSEVTVQIGILKTTVKAKDCIAMRGKAKSNAAGENFGKNARALHISSLYLKALARAPKLTCAA